MCGLWIMVNMDWEIEWWLREANGVFDVGTRKKKVCDVFYVCVCFLFLFSLMFATHVKRQWYWFVLLLWWWSSLNHAKALAHDMMPTNSDTKPYLRAVSYFFSTQLNMQFLPTLQLPCYIYLIHRVLFFFFLY